MDLSTLTNVYHYRRLDRRIDICFTLNGTDYTLVVLQDKDRNFKPYKVYDPYNNFMHSLEKHVEELFYALIEQPSIRLEWLYLPYKTL